MTAQAFDPERLKEMPREEALRSFVHQQLRPLLARDQMSRYIRIFAWENVRPSKVLTNFVTTGAMPFLASATELVRRFLPPGTSDQDVTCAAISLMGQCSVFVRNREQFAQSPFNLKIDGAFVARLADFISELALKGWRDSRKNHAAKLAEGAAELSGQVSRLARPTDEHLDAKVTLLGHP